MRGCCTINLTKRGVFIMAAQPITVPFVSFRPMERELDADLRAAFARVLDNSWYIEGKEDAAFEAAFADYCGAEYLPLIHIPDPTRPH